MLKKFAQKSDKNFPVVWQLLLVLLFGSAMAGANAQNVLPTVSMVQPPDGNYIAPAPIRLSATAADSDGSISYVNFYDNGTYVGTGYSAPYGLNWTATAGIHNLVAEAIDNQNASTMSSAVSVLVKANQLPIVSMNAPSSDTNYIGPAIVPLSANASDSDGTINYVNFFVNGSYVGTAYSAPFVLNWTATAGTHSVTAQALDDKGGYSMSTPVAVVVKANQKPTVSMNPLPPNAEYIGPAVVPLSATASDSDGTISHVSFYDNGRYLNTSYSAPFVLNWTADAGTHSITAQALDDKGDSTMSDPIPIVIKANQPPAVTLTSPTAAGSYLAPADIVLTASASDPDGTIQYVSYYRNGAYFITSYAAPYSINWTGVQPGTYTITAQARDDKNATTMSDPVVIVVAANAPPSVAIVAPLTNAKLVAPTNVTLQVNAADSDGTIAKVDYYLGTFYVGTATAAPYSFTWNDASVGDFILTAKAYDDKGGVTTSAGIPFSVVANALPTVSVTTTATPANMIAPATIPLQASAVDSDGTIVKVEFYNGTTLLGTANAAPYQFNWANVAAGSYSVVAKALDDKGGWATSAVLPVTIGVNSAPSVSLTSPLDAGTYYLPGTINLSANATDVDGTVVKVEFFKGATLIGSASSAPYTFAWSNATAGNYAITAKATDDKGATTMSSAVSVIVITAPVPVVSMTSPEPNARYGAPASFMLTASASITGDTISKVEYYSAGTLIGTSTAAPYAASLTNVPAGNYDVRAKATGQLGGSASSQVVYLEVSNNAAPQVTLSASQTNATAPAAITLTANAVDSDGQIVKVEFMHGSSVLATVTQAPYRFAWTDVAIGTYAITARVTDNTNMSSASNSVTVTVAGVGAPDTAEMFYVFSNQINTASQITNAQGTKVWESDPDPFGANLPNEDPAGQGQFAYNQRFPGQYFDSESGLHYNYQRDYDPKIGRYIQSDPIGLGGGVNTFLYVGGGPLDGFDPEGLCNCSGIVASANRLNNDYGYSMRGSYGRLRGYNKCSLFVYDVLKVTDVAPTIQHSYLGGLLTFSGGNISAGTWANPNAVIPNFPVVNNPQPGDIVSVAHRTADGATGHVAIVINPGVSSIGAGGRAGSHTTGWPWDSNLEPQGTPVYRRCTCATTK